MTQHKLENWAECPGFPDYNVSDLGRVRRVEYGRAVIMGRFMRPFLRVGEYVRLNLRLGDTQYTRSMHRLVALAFLGEPPEGKPEVNHINRVKTDNRANNLEWCSRKDNIEHAVVGGFTQGGGIDLDVITPAHVKQVRADYEEGMLDDYLNKDDDF